ncbi:hypothetical protein K493DRAFT_313773 [Basidiobolus meristosporus CBS 931.73]|uniref:Uncharacterized protein n=1 Tax=Basidiobolus meristosporus CBS 931.73 TaxID=1314790 RepID=A0A1Y1YJF2_9FUNG|nr:hypothetical protein K493DRAFT_313773 [Basidiobolus meristosporus CBS 931.73]|eukprot:ORX98157.1 hypothetical protein K493DRAFT_313773 [Basidiobolus meristosporus CBS 931.73]
MALTPDTIATAKSVGPHQQVESRCKKLVRFSRFEKVFITHSPDEYDRRSIFATQLPGQHSQFYQTQCF